MGALRRLIWLPMLFAATPAYAHAPVPGFKGFYVGLVHPFSTPSQALLLLGLGLVGGSFATSRIKWFPAVFLIATVVGLLVGSATLELDAELYGLAIATCALAALLPGRLMPVALICTALGGVLIGFVSIPDAGPAQDRMFTMSGSVFGASVGLLYMLGLMVFVQERYKQAWVMVAFRVVAAWLGAIALVMFALGTIQPVPAA